MVLDKYSVVTDQARFAGRVLRYHTWQVHHQQTVGEHCWQMALIYEQIFGPPSAEVERFIRYHDAGELIVGDPPFPVKSNNPELKVQYDKIEDEALVHLGISIPDIPANERVRVKVCDLLEMMTFGMMEVEMGNRLAIPIVRRTGDKARELAYKADIADKEAIIDWIGKQKRHHFQVMDMSDQ